jgi:hypothetical protein
MSLKSSKFYSSSALDFNIIVPSLGFFTANSPLSTLYIFSSLVLELYKNWPVCRCLTLIYLAISLKIVILCLNSGNKPSSFSILAIASTSSSVRSFGLF